MRAQVGTLSAQVGTLSAQVGTLSAQVRTLSAQVRTLSVQVRTLSSQVRTLRAQVGTLSAQVGTLSAQVRTLSVQVSGCFGAVNTQSGLCRRNAGANKEAGAPERQNVKTQRLQPLSHSLVCLSVEIDKSSPIFKASLRNTPKSQVLSMKS